MNRRALAAAFVTTLFVSSACSTTASHPAKWHEATDSICVYVGDPSSAVRIRVADEEMTVLRAVSESGLKGDLSRVSVLRGAGADAIRVDVDVREMILTGVTTHNVMLRPGDVVRIGS